MKFVLHYQKRCETFYTKVSRYVAQKLLLKGRWWPVVFSPLIFGLPFWGLFCWGFITTFDSSKFGKTLTCSIYFASLWIIIGPMLITIWELKYADFVRAINARTRKNTPQAPSFIKLTKLHTSGARYFGAIWTLITLGFFSISTSFIKPYTTMYDNDLVYKATVLVLAVSGFSCGYGISGVFQTLILFWKIGALHLEWKPFHHDQRGGYGFLGTFTFVTLVTFAGGIVVLPATIGIAGQVSDTSIYFVWAATFLYTILIGAVFAYPMIRIYLIAEKFKESKIRHISVKLNAIYRSIISASTCDRSAEEKQSLENFENLRAVEERIKKVSAIPFSPSIGFGAVWAIVSPVLSTGYEKFSSLVIPNGFKLPFL